MNKYYLLSNIGSPNSTNTKDVRIYLREFLMDPKVIQIPFIFRFILVYGIISFFRAPKSALKYKKIWLKAGSPLIIYTQRLAEKLAIFVNKENKDSIKSIFLLSMRYQNPNLKKALSEILNAKSNSLSIDNLANKSQNKDQLILCPMYPQFSESTTQSALDQFKQQIVNHQEIQKQFDLFYLKPFYNHPLFISSLCQLLDKHDLGLYDAVLLSYHGLPESQVLKNSNCHLCIHTSKCPDSGSQNNCYRAQCLQTTQLIKANYENKVTIPFFTTFQSRLGPTRWIQPYTDQFLKDAPSKGIKKLLVLTPAFVTDCLETLEEINQEGRELFLNSGGIEFQYIHCLNDNDLWISNFNKILQQNITPIP